MHHLIYIHAIHHLIFYIHQQKNSDSLMVPHGSQQSDITLEEEGDAIEQLYQKWFEEGYDIYDEDKGSFTSRNFIDDSWKFRNLNQKFRNLEQKFI